MRKRDGLLLALLLPLLVAWMNPLRDVTQEGRKHYDRQEYDAAIQAYLDAELRAPEDPRLAFSRGAVNYRMGKYEAALAELEKALSTDDPRLRAQVHYNTGNVHFRMENYPAAIESYIEALKLVPDHQDAKFNLELARRRLQEELDKQKDQQQQQQQEQQEQQEQEQKQEEPQEQEEREQQQAQSGDEEQEQPQPQEPREGEEPQEEPSRQAEEQPRQAEEISPEEAERILRNLARDEMEKRREYQRRRPATTGQVEKDW